MKRIIYTFILVITLAVSSIAQSSESDTVMSAPGITIETSVDRAEIYIGDLITYRLIIIHDSSIVLTPPPIGANLGAFDVKDYQTDEMEKLDDGKIKLQSSFVLTTFTTGDYIIPPIPIEFMSEDITKKYLISEPLPIKVKSLLAESADTADIRDIKGPIQFRAEIPLYYYFIGGGVLLLIAILFFWWWRRRQRGEPEEPIDTRDPWEIAFEAMAFLKEKNYPTKGEFKLYYIELSEIVRAYLQRIYKIPVMDMTTFEFLDAIREIEIEETLYNRFKLFLDYADLVKFAKFIPEPERMEADYEEAFAIIDYIRQLEISRVPEPVVTALHEDVQKQEAGSDV